MTADETIYKVYMHCMLSPCQSLLWAYSRYCLLCFSCMSTCHTLNQVSTPQTLRCTSLLSKLCYIVGKAANHKWEFMMGDCTQLLLYASQANLELGNTTVPCSAPEGLFLTNSFTSKVQLMLPLSRGGLVQTDAGLSWEITTYDTASQQRPEPDSINAFSHLHSWEALISSRMCF